MHPFLDNIKSIGSDELENRIAKLNQRLIYFRQNKMIAHEAYDQLQLLLDTLLFEKQERIIALQTGSVSAEDGGGVVLNTDPLPEEEEAAKQKAKPKSKQFSII